MRYWMPVAVRFWRDCMRRTTDPRLCRGIQAFVICVTSLSHRPVRLWLAVVEKHFLLLWERRSRHSAFFFACFDLLPTPALALPFTHKSRHRTFAHGSDQGAVRSLAMEQPFLQERALHMTTGRLAVARLVCKGQRPHHEQQPFIASRTN